MALILIGPCASGSKRRRDCRNESFRVGRDQVLGKFTKLGVSATDISVLRSAKFGDIRLTEALACENNRDSGDSYVDIKPYNRVFLARPFQSGDFSLEPICRGRRLVRILSRPGLVSGRGLGFLRLSGLPLLRRRRLRGLFRALFVSQVCVLHSLGQARGPWGSRLLLGGTGRWARGLIVIRIRRLMGGSEGCLLRRHRAPGRRRRWISWVVGYC